MSAAVHVAGIGMIPFTTPSKGALYTDMGAQAIGEALADAGLSFDAVEQAYAGYVYGDSTSGQNVVYRAGLTGIPVINVNNNCSTGSTALYLARQAIAHGAADCVLAVGFEQMTRGALQSYFADRPNPLDPFAEALARNQGYEPETPVAAQFFGGGGREHMEKYGTSAESFAAIAVKARRHAARNPKAVFREELSLEQILASPMIFAPLTRLQCCPPTNGAAAAILCSDAFMRKHSLTKGAVIKAQAMATDTTATFDSGSRMDVIGFDMSSRAAQAVYEASGIGPEDIRVCELHDCFTANELVTYESLGLTAEGTAERFIRDGDNSFGGRCVTNPSGGLLSKGHPLGATGLAQCYELVSQLRGTAGARQVEGARIALQHNLGLGGACVVTLYAQA
ncbi:MAG TPA: lipid-transfer protein [Sphingopyxis sp.]|nr:lipid-transfer protein [Sphingopyxis sp.]HMP43845.1 lipid-transfer protein [Sphingopyxis sp.]HMQ18322.1 lipid-transfer protein [Sphingopyxis sp.]